MAWLPVVHRYCTAKARHDRHTCEAVSSAAGVDGRPSFLAALTTPRSLFRNASGSAAGPIRASAHGDQVDHEHEGFVGPDHPTSTPLTVGEHWRNRDPAPSTYLHADHTLVPAGNDLALPKAELERLATVPGRVELLARLPRDTHVVDFDHAPGDGLLAIADDDVLEFELVGRRLIGGNLDLRLLAGGHNTDRSDCGPRSASRGAYATRTRPSSLVCDARPRKA